MKIKTVKQIDVDDWDKLVEDTYGKPYSFQQQDGCKSRGVEYINTHDDYLEDFEDTELPFEVNGEEMGVSFETWLNTDPKETAKKFNPNYTWENNLFWERNFYPHPSMIAKDLYEKGLLEAGEYEIKIDW
jgi:hypothetical protein